jgi:hypothetical protein
MYPFLHHIPPLFKDRLCDINTSYIKGMDRFAASVVGKISVVIWTESKKYELRYATNTLIYVT